MAALDEELGSGQLASIWQHAIPAEELKRVIHGFQPVSKRQRGRDAQEASSQLLQILGRLVLKHEDAINTQLSESQFVLHMQIGAGSIVPQLLELSQKWHQEQAKKQPLRHVLARAMIQELLNRLTQLSRSPTTPK